MGAFERITIELPAETAEALRKSVTDGDYPSEGQIVAEALRDWTHARGGDAYDVEQLRLAVREADESGPPLPADQVFADVYARIDRMARRQADE